jgi:hypothetical protein
MVTDYTQQLFSFSFFFFFCCNFGTDKMAGLSTWWLLWWCYSEFFVSHLNTFFGLWHVGDDWRKFCFFLPMSTWEKILISEILFVKINKRMSVDVCRQVFHIDSRFSSLSFLLNGTSLEKKDAQQMWNANFSRFGYCCVCRRPPLICIKCVCLASLKLQAH